MMPGIYNLQQGITHVVKKALPALLPGLFGAEFRIETLSYLLPMMAQLLSEPTVSICARNFLAGHASLRGRDVTIFLQTIHKKQMCRYDHAMNASVSSILRRDNLRVKRYIFI